MTTESTTKEALEPGAGGHVHRFNAVRVPPEFGHSYLRCAYCGLSKHLESHDASTCDICARVSAPIVAPVVDDDLLTPLDEIEAALISIAEGTSPEDAVRQAFDVINRERLKRNAAPASPAALRDERIPQTALYWLRAAKDESHSMAERLFYMENAYNHVVNALYATTPPSTLARKAAVD